MERYVEGLIWRDEKKKWQGRVSVAHIMQYKGGQVGGGERNVKLRMRAKVTKSHGRVRPSPLLSPPPPHPPAPLFAPHLQRLVRMHNVFTVGSLDSIARHPLTPSYPLPHHPKCQRLVENRTLFCAPPSEPAVLDSRTHNLRAELTGRQTHSAVEWRTNFLGWSHGTLSIYTSVHKCIYTYIT